MAYVPTAAETVSPGTPASRVAEGIAIRGSRIVRSALLLWVFLGSSACSPDRAPTDVTTPTVVAAVSLARPRALIMGDTVLLQATVRDIGGRVINRPLNWTSRDPAIAAVDASGRLRALVPGEVVIVVDAANVRDSARITVSPGGGIRYEPATALDSAMLTTLAARRLVGGAVGVMQAGRLVYARGFGWADSAARRSALPTTIFRLFSVSKTVTAAAVLRAVDERRIRLTDSAFVIRSDLTPLPGMSEDPRMRSVRLEHLLWFASGLLYSYPDPALDCWRGGSLGREGHVRCVRGLPLGFDPGTRQAYTNDGSLVLARVLEKVTGLPYDEYVAQNVLQPGNATGLALGQSRLADRPPEETRYYPNDWAALYGTRTSMEQYDATGGWTGTVATVLRVLRAVTGGGSQPSILSPVSRALLVERPAFAAQMTEWFGLAPLFYAMAEGSGHRFEGMGAGSDGGCMLYSHAPDGVSYVYAFNTTPVDCWDINNTIKPIVRAVPTWPAHDLFMSLR